MELATIFNSDFIIVAFLCHGWTDSRHIWYADAKWHPKVESVAKIVIFVCAKTMLAAAILNFGRIANILHRMVARLPQAGCHGLWKIIFQTN